MMTLRMTPLTASGDAELVRASRGGDRDAFGQIVVRYQSLVCSLAYSATGSLTQSEDLAQETFIAAWKHLDDLREPGKLRSWLRGIARNVINNALRDQGRDPGHRAQPLEEAFESQSVGPLPVERAISQEEADILWRSLERIPEPYRVPLVLYYREHQSIGAVALNLDLTEEAVRQRLSRGRKLLQDEVRSLVESALEKTAPGKTFTVAVIAALPLGAASAQATTLGAVAAKGGLGGKGALTLGALSGFLGMLAAVVLSWKTAADDARSPRQRRLMLRTAWFQIPFLVLCVLLVALLVPLLDRHPMAAGSALAILFLVILVNSVILPQRLSRRLTAIALEEGVEMDVGAAKSGQDADQQALRKAVRWIMPVLLMFVVGLLYMPWKDRWGRCALVAGAEIAVFIWAFRRYRRTLIFEVQPKQPSSPIQRFLRHPLVLMPAILLGAGLLGAVLPFFLYSRPVQPTIHYGPIRTFGLVVLLAVFVYAALAVIGTRLARARVGTAGKLGGILKILASVGGADLHGIVQQTYAAFFEQAKLTPDQCARLRDLIVELLTAQTTATRPLTNRKLDAARRAELVERLKHASDGADAQIRELLGPELHPIFQQYNRTVLDRTRLRQFSAICSKQGCPLRPEQQEQLLQALLQARSEFPWTTPLSRHDHFTGCHAAILNPTNIDAFVREEEDFDRQFVTQAQAILTQEQLAAFIRLQSSQRSSQTAQLRMTARLLAPTA